MTYIITQHIHVCYLKSHLWQVLCTGRHNTMWYNTHATIHTLQYTRYNTHTCMLLWHIYSKKHIIVIIICIVMSYLWCHTCDVILVIHLWHHMIWFWHANNIYMYSNIWQSSQNLDVYTCMINVTNRVRGQRWDEI